MKTRKNKNVFDFSLNDYNSNDGMLTAVWGPSFWHFLHSMSFNYPINPTESDKKHYMDFIVSMKHILPCGKCRKNLKKNLELLPITRAIMVSRNSFSKYVFDLHEVINKMLCKVSGLSYEDVRETYEHFRARCVDNKEVDEEGCVVPYYGKKKKCVLRVVAQSKKCKSFSIE